ncbi:GlxA family transcriptional regulator [Flavitalea antarctica]
MKHISILVYEEVVLTALSSITSLLTSANEAAIRRGKPVPFQVDLVGVHVRKVQLKLPVQFTCDKTISDKFNTDVVVIPPAVSSQDDMNKLLSKNKTLIAWVKKNYAEGAQVISLCTGAYFAAEAGLLNGMPATSHWGAIEDLQKRYPLIHFQPDLVVTNSKAIITGGGGFSSLNAMLYFIENACSKEVAIELSKFYGLDYGRTSQSVFTIFSGQRQHNDHAIHEAQTLIERQFKTDISVEQIAGQVNMSKRNFIRRFKNATSLNPIEFIQKIKVEAAKKALEAGETNIAAVTYDVGYNDLKTFRTVFKKITGLTPMEYRNKYNQAYPPASN